MQMETSFQFILPLFFRKMRDAAPQSLPKKQIVSDFNIVYTRVVKRVACGPHCGPPCCLLWPVLRLTLLKNYMEVKISMQLQNYIAIISVANRDRNSLGQPKHVHSSACAFSKYCRSDPVPKPLPRACPKGQKPRPHRHLLPSTLYICLKIQDGYIPQS